MLYLRINSQQHFHWVISNTASPESLVITRQGEMLPKSPAAASFSLFWAYGQKNIQFLKKFPLQTFFLDTCKEENLNFEHKISPEDNFSSKSLVSHPMSNWKELRSWQETS